MAFKLIPDPTFKSKVTLRAPGKKEEKVEFTFRFLNEEERRSINEAQKAKVDELRNQFGVPEEEIEAAIKSKTLDEQTFNEYLRSLRAVRLPYFMKIVAGWELIDDFNEENVAALLRNYSSAFNSILETYRDEVEGARIKN